MFVWVSILGIVLSWLGNELLRARRQHEIAETIQRLGGRCRYDYDPVEIRGTRPHGRLRGRWLTALVGPDLFAHLAGVYFDENTKLQDGDLKFLKELPRLQAVELYGPGITDQTLSYLQGARNLRGLHLDDTLVTPAAVGRLAAAGRLEYFTLLGPTAADAGSEHLVALANLRSLNLCSFSRFSGFLRAFTDEGLSHIAELRKLETLYLTGEVTDRGLRHLRGLEGLTGLAITAPNVSDAGMEHVAVLTKLTFLNLQGSTVGDAGIAQLKDLKNLEFLGLDDTQITDEATATIAQLPALKTLMIARTAVTNNGLLNLKKSLQLRRLEVAPNVTQAGLVELSKALPQCRIHGSDGMTEFNLP
jgi:hypothetical protein